MNETDWRRLEDLRSVFLGEGTRGAEERGPTPDYWHSERDLELYDAFLGRRIAWKWAGALDELVARGWTPPAGTVLDFGCGTGAAAGSFLDAFGAEGVSALHLVDRSAQARAFAARKLGEDHPGLEVLELDPGRLTADADGPAVLLVSHVLNELDDAAIDRLLVLARRARSVIWVEPAERATSRALSDVHDRLLPGARVLAPCPHQLGCGALKRPEEWCHHFARAPVDAFTTREWTLFAKRLGVDLRSLPYSWIALERAEHELRGHEPREQEGLLRVIGRPHTFKGRMTLHACFDGEVREVVLLDRDGPALAKLLREPKGRPLLARVEFTGPERERIAAGEAVQPDLGEN